MSPDAVSDISMPSVSEYKAALQEMDRVNAITDNQREMLRAQYHAPDHAMTARELAQAVGYRSWRGANVQYGLLGKRMRETMSYRGVGQESYILSSFRQSEEVGDEWLFVMHSELAQALEELGWV
jgi:hypothetical protein